MRILLIAPYYDKNTPGESWSTYKWVEGISERFDTTVLTYHKPGWSALASPTKAGTIINWKDFSLPTFLKRLDWELKPGYVRFYWKVLSWLEANSRHLKRFDLIHQINPLALRYPSPAASPKFSSNIPLVIGPLAGSLPSPAGFAGESHDKQLYRKLRYLDALRIKYDPLLRRSYSRAAAIIGVAPYVREHLASVKIKRFEIMSETGIEPTFTEPKKYQNPSGPLKLLYVGRIIRTKGVIDAIRAVAIASKVSPLEFNIIGDGDNILECRREVERLNISNLVTFHGRLSRGAVGDWYSKSEVFLFPSYREPSGNVVFEAMAAALPIIAADRGGPGFLVTPKCGVKIQVSNPSRYASELASAIIQLSQNRSLLSSMSKEALARVTEVAAWPRKIDRIADLYGDLSRNDVCSSEVVF